MKFCLQQFLSGVPQKNDAAAVFSTTTTTTKVVNQFGISELLVMLYFETSPNPLQLLRTKCFVDSKTSPDFPVHDFMRLVPT